MPLAGLYCKSIFMLRSLVLVLTERLKLPLIFLPSFVVLCSMIDLKTSLERYRIPTDAITLVLRIFFQAVQKDGIIKFANVFIQRLCSSKIPSLVCSVKHHQMLIFPQIFSPLQIHFNYSHLFRKCTFQTTTATAFDIASNRMQEHY